MTGYAKVTLAVLGSCIAVVLLLEVGLIIMGYPTISEQTWALSKSTIVPAAFFTGFCMGVLGAHLFWQRKYIGSDNGNSNHEA